MFRTRMLLPLIFILHPSSFIRAEDPVHPVTYATPTADGKFLFVMLAPPDADPNRDPDAQPNAKVLRQTYAKSGLYRAGETAAPEWAVDWYAYTVYPSVDGVHMVRLDDSSLMLAGYITGNRLAPELVKAQYEAPALTFLDRGKPLKTYTVKDVIADPAAMPHSVNHVLWMADGSITRDGSRFVLSTQDARQIIFDMTTGEVVVNRAAGLGNVQVWTVRGLMAFVLLFIAAGAWKTLRPAKPAAA